MAYPEPRNREDNFPERAIRRISVSKEIDHNETEEESLSPEDILLLTLAALRVLENDNGSTMNEIRRILVSGGFITPSIDIRPALILGLKGNVIKRPLSAIKAGVYGRYVEVKENTTGKSSAKKLKSISARQVLGNKHVKRCQRTSKRSVAQVERYRLAL
ncbi:hypothetical protein ElyMa_006297900 [Elysia marginata]|uniref:H15 domain-containing protein n=1 Tax=Elysia marginata TaxID=1093978 RepID=A0AAV4HFM8_9GAST|nr:hypothetical protein ElyMa_006297900 [Elysia marginata]